MNTRAIAGLLLILSIWLGFVFPTSAQAWIELKGPAQTTYTAPGTYQFQINSGVVGTGPKAEFLTDMRLLRNNVPITTLPVGTYTENGISAGTYDYVLKATAIKYINGDEYTRFLTSPVIRIVVAAPPAPFDGAEFVSSSIPRNMDRGLSYAGSVTFRNAGNTTWRAGEGYQLGQAEAFSSAPFGIGAIAVPYDVAPGQTVQFNFTAVAPMAVGDYLLHWQMNRNGVRFGTSSGAQTIVVAGKYNHATSYEQDIPTSMVAGRSYAVRIRYRNGGNTTWSAANNYKLGSWNPENNGTWGVARVPVVDQVPGGIGALFEFNVTAPSLPGTYNFQWRMLEEGVEWFGEPTQNVQVTVTGAPSQVVGNIDGVSDSGVLTGWACSTRIDAPIDVHVYLGGAAGTGTFGLSGSANQPSEPAVGTACSASGNHRFALQISNALRQQFAGKTIHVHGISPVGQPNSLLGTSGYFTVPAAPAGTLQPSLSACTLATGAQSCTVRLAWTANDSRAQLVRGIDGGVLGSGTSGAVDVAVSVGANIFKLMVAGDVVAQTSVTGKAAPSTPGTPANPAATVTRRFVYDQNQRLCKIIEPESGVTVLGYDGVGNLVWSAQGVDLPDTGSCDQGSPLLAARRIVRTYDSRNRVKTVAYPDGLGDQVSDYTPDGLLASSTTRNGPGQDVVTQRTYNSLRSLESHAIAVGTQAPEVFTVGYNTMGQPDVLGYPGGYLIRQVHNALGQVVRLEDGAGTALANNASYAADGTLASVALGNGIPRVVSRNQRQLVQSISDAAAINQSYAYDATANLVRITDGIRGAQGDINVSYDPLRRMIQADSPVFGGNGSISLGYDTLDNVVFSRLPGKRERSFEYDGANRLQLLRDGAGNGVAGFAYDAAGNMTVRSGQTFTFDIGGRLRSAGLVQAFAYNAEGYRTAAQGPNNPTWHYLDGGRLIHATEGDTAFDYVYLGSELLAVRSSGAAGTGMNYLHHDAMGNLAAISDGVGNITQRIAWTPYGEPDAPVPAGVPGFGGHLVDAGLGLIYMGQRYYDPQLGRFISTDPVTAYANPAGAFNRYWYANNNPYRFLDPDGRAACPTGTHICYESTRSETGKTVQPGPNAATQQKDAQAAESQRSGRMSDGTRLNTNQRTEDEQGIRVTGKGTYTNPLLKRCWSCSNGKSGSGGIYNVAALEEGDSPGHTHPELIEAIPGPGDAGMASKPGETSYVFTRAGLFGVERTEVGYRVRQIEGPKLRGEDLRNMIKQIDSWNRNDGAAAAKGVTCSSKSC